MLEVLSFMAIIASAMTKVLGLIIRFKLFIKIQLVRLIQYYFVYFNCLILIFLDSFPLINFAFSSYLLRSIVVIIAQFILKTIMIMMIFAKVGIIVIIFQNYFRHNSIIFKYLALFITLIIFTTFLIVCFFVLHSHIVVFNHHITISYYFVQIFENIKGPIVIILDTKFNIIISNIINFNTSNCYCMNFNNYFIFTDDTKTNNHHHYPFICDITNFNINYNFIFIISVIRAFFENFFNYFYSFIILIFIISASFHFLLFLPLLILQLQSALDFLK